MWWSAAVLIYAWGETRFSSVQAIGKEQGQGIERGKLYSVEYASLHCLGPLAHFSDVCPSRNCKQAPNGSCSQISSHYREIFSCQKAHNRSSQHWNHAIIGKGIDSGEGSASTRGLGKSRDPRAAASTGLFDMLNLPLSHAPVNLVSLLMSRYALRRDPCLL